MTIVKIVLLVISWTLMFWLAERELSGAKPLPKWANALSFPAMMISALGIVHFTSVFVKALPQAIWVCPVIGVITPIWILAVKADRRTTASMLFGMLAATLIAFALWPQPKPEEIFPLPTIAEVRIPNPDAPKASVPKADDNQLHALQVPASKP